MTDNLLATISAASSRLATAFEKIAESIEGQQPEAPASISAKVFDPNGIDLIVTVRNSSMKKLAGDWKQFSNYLMTQGFKPQSNRIPQPPVAPPEPTPYDDPVALKQAEMDEGGQSAPTTSQPNGATGETRIFEAQELKFAGDTKSSGKPFWKVYGGTFMQFGVPIYEALNQALTDGIFFDDELVPGTKYDLTGILAHYITKENGQPKKVIRLQRPGQ